MDENEIGTKIIGFAVRIHRELGPGLFESVYEAVLADSLGQAKLRVERQVVIPIAYDGRMFDEGFRADLIVERKVILELKCAQCVAPVHRKQMLTYLRLSGLRLGYVLNFGAVTMRDGIVRLANRLPSSRC